MIEFLATTNIENKVRNTRLPRTKPLMPLFEVISNSIHSIKDAIDKGNLYEDQGLITIECIRNGSHDVLSTLDNIDIYPIHSFKIKDNGIGLNEENLKSFTEADSDHKIEIGGKGVGRFVCLKAFKVMKVKSRFYNQSKKTDTISFDFKATKEGFHNIAKPNLSDSFWGTEIILSNIREEFQRNLDKELYLIAKEIVAHFQLYFIRKQIPTIIIKNQNNYEYNLASLFDREFKNDINEKAFTLLENEFVLYLAKSAEFQSHKIHFCAHNRSVINEGLYSRIIDLGRKPISISENEKYFYQAFVVSNLLDEFVDTERIGFDFPEYDSEDENQFDEVTLSKIRNAAINSIEEILKDFLLELRTKKVEKYKPTIFEELPQYRSTLKYKKEQVLKLPPDLTKDKLDIELYKIESQWKQEVKEEKIKLLEEKKDITNLEEYKDKYEKFLTEYNEIGQADLARYIVHRRTIIDLLESLLEQNSNDKFENEDLIHTLFFPIRTTSDDVPYEKQNLWLIDERLTYHSFLASDKIFKTIGEIEVESSDRSDLLIYNGAFAFSDTKHSPHNSFTIVEFKKPMRDDYKDYDEKENPIEQVEKYIDLLLTGKAKDHKGRYIEITNKTPFYIYIICDITPSLTKVLHRREFEKTPDGKGYFRFKSKYYSAYIEVLPFEKVLNDAKKRNRILFDKLNL
ncbi:ATP-binding protein [Elizabethkingia anophelis]|uniref:ATP-binding protein n=1 Tax=Elizabethkingia anophelis TaxID=1117645 RepID=UPI001370679D|nr:ATP-binding protein [Elizabethkingia anophelis]MCT4206753.1 ATP-binding protein [Elizabethkingia anophelis]MCT4210267.1 ATP-binding protein [Elizabethkingia anophelis]MYY25874.1 ATP-binding protein [Elizabethkingia anophelis]